MFKSTLLAAALLTLPPMGLGQGDEIKLATPPVEVSLQMADSEDVDRTVAIKIADSDDVVAIKLADSDDEQVKMADPRDVLDLKLGGIPA